MIKYGIGISLLLNAILLMQVLGIFPFLLYISILINVALIWYLFGIVKESDNIRNDIELIFESIEEYTNHLEQVHQLEIFYGDQNLQDLIKHSKRLINNFIDLQEKFYDDIEVTDDNDEENQEEAPSTDEE